MKEHCRRAVHAAVDAEFARCARFGMYPGVEDLRVAIASTLDSGVAPPCETTFEQEVLDSLAAAWNTFVVLKPTHPDDVTDFRRAIHDAQRIMAVRRLRREDPEQWPAADEEI